MTLGSVLIPAHNESRLLARLLPVLAPLQAEGVELLVVTNGCTDDSADIARRNGVPVLDIPQASKRDALNAGDAQLTALPRVYLDADVTISAHDVRELLVRLAAETGPVVGAPGSGIDLSRSSRLVRRYVGIWSKTTYVSVDLVGAGVYALNAAGRARFGEFPPLIADDLFVQRLFTPQEVRVYRDLHFSTVAPATMVHLMRRLRRTAGGNLQLEREVPAAELVESEGLKVRVRRLVAAIDLPRDVPGFGLYCMVWGVANLQARADVLGGRPLRWRQDRSTRV